MKAIRILSLVCALVLTAALLVPALADSTTYAYVVTGNGGKLNVRCNPSSQADIVDRLAYRTQVTIVNYSSDGQWAQIRFQGAVGWVAIRYLSFTDPGPYEHGSTSTQESEDIAAMFKSFSHVTAYNVYVKPSSPTTYVCFRWAPTKAAPVMQKCYQGYNLQVIAVGDGWCQVSDPLTGYVGYMMTCFLVRTY